MAVSHSVLTEGADDTNATSYTTASVLLASGKAYALGVLGRRNGLSPTTPTVTGGPTWTGGVNVQFGTIASPICRMRIYTAYGDGTTTALTLDYGATTMSGCLWILVELTGVDGTTIAVQAGPANQRGDAGTALLSTLAAFASAENATLGFFGINTATTLTVGSGFTAAGNQSNATDIMRLRAGFRADNDTTVDATAGGTADWAVIGAEIKAAAAGGVVPIMLAQN